MRITKLRMCISNKYKPQTDLRDTADRTLVPSGMKTLTLVIGGCGSLTLLSLLLLQCPKECNYGLGHCVAKKQHCKYGWIEGKCRRSPCHCCVKVLSGRATSRLTANKPGVPEHGWWITGCCYHKSRRGRGSLLRRLSPSPASDLRDTAGRTLAPSGMKTFTLVIGGCSSLALLSLLLLQILDSIVYLHYSAVAMPQPRTY
ncbi:hypothetical protein O3P69_003097 [Scylla paramamosain]|uniref:Uncharacterized protein n=1 Tax=Scylla paramamosain TaxID=85552 RepID=A0AAW0UJ40_SCYPA